MKKYWIYFLLAAPIVLAVLALNGYGFFFKSGTAGSGILILLFIYFKKTNRNKDLWMLIGAFGFSIAGDWFLSNMKENSGIFVTEIALYFIAHFGYLTYAVYNGKINKVFTGLLLIGFLVFYFITLFPAIEGGIMKSAVLIYLLISCLSLGAAVGLKTNVLVKWSYTFGIALILFSDTVISFKEFVGYNGLNYLILPTYYLAHISIIFSVLTEKVYVRKKTNIHL